MACQTTMGFQHLQYACYRRWQNGWGFTLCYLVDLPGTLFIITITGHLDQSLWFIDRYHIAVCGLKQQITMCSEEEFSYIVSFELMSEISSVVKLLMRETELKTSLAKQS